MTILYLGNSCSINTLGIKMIKTWQTIVSALFLLLLLGCSGSKNSQTATVASTLSFPLQSAYNLGSATGWTKPFTISGTCSGSGSRTVTPATTSTIFEGVAALSGVDTYNFSFADCTTPANNTVATTNYFDSSSKVPLGQSSVSLYGVFLASTVIPMSVTVGGAGVIGTLTLYTDSTKTVPNGRHDISYVIEPETSTTAIVNEVVKSYNTIGILTLTTQVRARIALTGALTPISVTNDTSSYSIIWIYQ